jgi:2-polyprenyl-6-methoxyphenol hydroxylase-like FAD-dependent oxidoreductase
MTNHADVIVVGAGPVGLITALGLARQGLNIILVDSADAINDSPRAAVYFPTSLDCLEPLGVIEEILASGLHATTFSMHYRDFSVQLTADMLLSMPKEARYRFNLQIGQDVICAILLKAFTALPNARMLWRHTLIGLEQSATNVTLTVQSPQGPASLRADYVVGADGARSTTRQLLGLPFEGFTWPERFVATNILYDFERHGFSQSNMLVHPEHWAVIVRLGHEQLWRVTYGENADLDEATMLRRVPEHMAALLPGNEPYELRAAAPYRCHERCVAKFRQGRVLLAGDAAHVNNPCGGFGLTTGIADAAALITVLGAVMAGRQREAALDVYAEDRRRVFTTISSPAATAAKTMLAEADDAKRRANLDSFAQALADNSRPRPAILTAQAILGHPMPE